MDTYGQLCINLSKWFKESGIELTPDEIFNLDTTFPALMLGTLSDYIDRFDATTVCVSDEYVAKKVFLKLEAKGLV